MKPFIVCLILVGTTLAQMSTTPNLGLNLPPYNYPAGNTSVNQNFSVIDDFLSGQRVLPNLRWRIANGVPNAANYPGSDACAKINNAIAAACANALAIVDATGFTGNQACAASITVSCGLHMKLASGRWTLNGNPGINVTTSDPVFIEGSGAWEYSYNPSGNRGTVLISGTAAPLIQDLSSGGSQWNHLELNGNNVGTVGFLAQANGGSGYLFRDIHVHHFLYTGMILPGTGLFMDRLMVNNNGGDGILSGSSPQLNGVDSEIADNGGNGWHSIGEGPLLTGLNVDRSRLNGFYADGRIPQPWVSSTRYISPSLLIPGTNYNPGKFYFYSENVNCTTGTYQPVWPQTIGARITDGTCIWVNISALNGGHAPAVGEAQSITLSHPAILRSGHHPISGYRAANIRLEGASSGNRTCGLNNILSGINIDMGPADPTDDADGLHLMNCEGGVISGFTYLGRSHGNSENPAEGYGLLIEQSDHLTITSYQSTWGTKSPLNIVAGSDLNITGLSFMCWANSKITDNDRYAVQIDRRSGDIQFTSLKLNAVCGRTEKGVLNAGNQVYIDNLETQGTAPDSLGDAVLTNAHGRQSGVPLEFNIGGLAVLSLDGTGAASAGPAALPRGLFQAAAFKFFNISGNTVYLEASPSVFAPYAIRLPSGIGGKGQPLVTDGATPANLSFAPGITGTKTAGACTFTIVGGIITHVSGC